MQALLIAAILALFGATASAETLAKPLATHDPLSKQFVGRECAYLSKYRIATTALDAEPKGHDLRSPCVNECAERRADTGSRHTLILGVAY
jgi:hypothetical protein